MRRSSRRTSPIRDASVFRTSPSPSTKIRSSSGGVGVLVRFTREALAIDVDRDIDADGVVDVLDGLVLQHGAPHYVRFDNGPEFVAHAVHDWCRFNSAGSLFIDPGSPWENAWIESFNGRLRDELLNSWRFDSLLEARVIIEDWRCDYDANRPHSAHGELHPSRVRSTVDHDPPTPSRIATGPLIGSPSPRPRTRILTPCRFSYSMFSRIRMFHETVPVR